MYICRYTVATKLDNTLAMSFRGGHTTKMFMKNYAHVGKDKNIEMSDLVMNSRGFK